jgi:demethylmenaquinone methyltransferase/2-methoxy-6-polyprenyl-1,4-benzoquinol methylase
MLKLDKSQTAIKEIFSSVASKYDLMNNVMSLGIHHLWKDCMVRHLTNTNSSLLDVAGGTGDIVIRYLKKAKISGNMPKVVLCDINQDMIDQGKIKLQNLHLDQNVEFICGDAMALPFNDMSFDYYTIAFGIRNIHDMDQALKEAYRVLKPGGKFICLEFSKVTNCMFSKVYDVYSEKIIPLAGKYIANDQAAYEYLVDSIKEFPSQQKFLQMIKDAGFEMASYTNLSGGIAAIHYGYKL